MERRVEHTEAPPRGGDRRGLRRLALAIRLQSAGVRTTVFEARDKPGGRAYVYEDKGLHLRRGPRP
jgi:protoporphyrinogen oxidase